jgi:hypothetical protein
MEVNLHYNYKPSDHPKKQVSRSIIIKNPKYKFRKLKIKFGTKIQKFTPRAARHGELRASRGSSLWTRSPQARHELAVASWTRQILYQLATSSPWARLASWTDRFWTLKAMRKLISLKTFPLQSLRFVLIVSNNIFKIKCNSFSKPLGCF